MYLKLNIEGLIEKYPYTTEELRFDNPSVSFPEYMSDELLSIWNVFPVTVSSKPPLKINEQLVENLPTYINEQWTQSWSIKEKTFEQLFDSIYDHIREHLNNVSIQRGYDNITLACSYAAAPNPFQEESKQFVTWMGNVWNYFFQQMEKVKIGERTIDNLESFLLELPSLNL